MTKELEALNTIRKNLSNKTLRFNLVELLDIIESALQRLEAIDNAKPSEALECLEEMWELSCDSRKPEYTLYETIKQTLIKAEKEHKALEIIKEKNVEVKLLKLSTNWLDYYTRVKHKTGYNTELTEEEFDLLKQQEPKHYLKWEDLEFKEYEEIDVLMNGNKYILEVRPKDTRMENLDAVAITNVNKGGLIVLCEFEAETFNDLRLERVEE